MNFACSGSPRDLQELLGRVVYIIIIIITAILFHEIPTKADPLEGEHSRGRWALASLPAMFWSWVVAESQECRFGR